MKYFYRAIELFPPARSLLFLFPVIVNLFPVAAVGPDYDNYMAYFLRGWGDGHFLFLDGHFVVNHQSPGVYIAWLPLFAIRKLLVEAGASAGQYFDYVVKSNAALSALLLWLAFRMMEKLRVRKGVAIGAILAAFFGTQWFFYTFIRISSEVPSALAVFVIFYALCSLGFSSARDFIFLGVAGGIALDIRSNNAAYIVFAFACLTIAMLRRDRGLATIRRLFLLYFTAAVASAPHLIVNGLYTGSPFRFAQQYVLPSGRDLWFEYSRPQVAATLFSHFHGLLIYSPLFAIAFAGAVAFAVRPGGASPFKMSDKFEDRFRAQSMVVLAYFILHTYMAAAWRCWGFGTGTFGGRQFINFAPFAALSIAYLFGVARKTKWAAPLAALVAVCAVWTLLLATQGHTNFTHGYNEVLASAARAVREAGSSPASMQALRFAAAVLIVTAAGSLLERNGGLDIAARILVGLLIAVKICGDGPGAVESLVLFAAVLGGSYFIRRFSFSRPSFSYLTLACFCAALAVGSVTAKAAIRTRAAIEENPSLIKQPYAFDGKKCRWVSFDYSNWRIDFEEHKGLPGWSDWKIVNDELMESIKRCESMNRAED